jgi:hypothetical protein
VETHYGMVPYSVVGPTLDDMDELVTWIWWLYIH